MDVKVKDRLVALAPVGLQQGDSGWLEGGLDGFGHTLRSLHNSGGLLGRQVQQRGGMALGGYQHMAGVDLPDVHEGEGHVVLVHPGRRYFASHQ